MKTSRNKQNGSPNPCLLIEVLSELTKNYDRGVKFERCRSIP